MKKKFRLVIKHKFWYLFIFGVLALGFLTIFMTYQNKKEASTGTIYYISPSGSDTNTGITESDPLKTIQKGISKANAGDTVMILPGTYYESLIITKSGNEGNPITIKGTDTDQVIIDGTGKKSCVHLTYPDSNHPEYQITNNITIENVSIQNCNIIDTGTLIQGFGVVGWYNTDNIVLRNLKMSNMGTPIKFSAASGNEPYISDNILIQNVNANNYKSEGISLGGSQGSGVVSHVTITNVDLLGIEGGNNTAQDGISAECAYTGCSPLVDANGSPLYVGGITIQNTTIKFAGGDGIDMKADDVAIKNSSATKISRNGLKIWGKNFIIENTKVQTNLLECLVIAGGAKGPFTLSNNIFISNNSSSFQGYPHTADNVADVYLFGNIIYTDNPNNGSATFTTGQYLNLEMKNNIIYSSVFSESQKAVSSSLFRYYDGAVYHYCSGDEINGIDTNMSPACVRPDISNMSINPLFNDSANGDYTLASGSPAIDKISGTAGTDFPPDDYLGYQRPEPGGTKADIGAYEANSSGGPPIITSLPLSITAYVDTDIVITPTVVNATSYKWDKVSPTDPITLSNPELLVNHPTSDTPTGKANGSNGYQIKFTATNDKGSSEKTITIYIYKRADIDGSGTVDSADFFALLGQWGKTDKDNMANVDLLVTKGVAVDSADFFYLLGKWGK